MTVRGHLITVGARVSAPFARIRSWWFWRNFQRHYARRIAEARGRHAATRQIRAEQTARLHAALAGKAVRG